MEPLPRFSALLAASCAGGAGPEVWIKRDDLPGLGLAVPHKAMRTVGGYGQPEHSLPNARMVEAVQWLARSENLLLDPVYTGKAMAGLIGLAREGFFKPAERVLFLHSGGLPSLFAYVDVPLGAKDLPP